MADVQITRMTYAELLKRIGADGNMVAIAEVLQQKNEILKDAPWYPANGRWFNKTTRRAQEPSGTWRGFNEGISGSKSETTEVQDVVGLLEDKSEVDCEIIDSAPDPTIARSQEDQAFVGGLAKEMAQTCIYGNAYTNPKEFNGLSTRLDALNSSLYNVVGAGGSGSDLTSIYVVNWGRGGAWLAYPPGTMGGLEVIDRGKQEVLDASSNGYLAYQTWFKWRCGLVVEHPRAIGRVCNIEDAGASNTFNEDNLIDLMVQMELDNAVIYVNRTVMAQMWKRLKDKTNVFLRPAEGLEAGGPPMYFNGVPVRRVDQITITEGAVS